MVLVYSVMCAANRTITPGTKVYGIRVCVDSEAVSHNGGVLLEEGGSKCNTITENHTPPTQQFVSGWIDSSRMS